MSEAREDIEGAYRTHRDALVRLAFLLCGSRDAAEDAVHGAFASAAARWDSIEQQGPYLRRAVVNRVRDVQRRESRRHHDGVPEAVTHIAELDETWAQIQKLPARQRIVVVLRYYSDMSLTDIADMLERPEGTVRSTLHRALERLRKELS